MTSRVAVESGLLNSGVPASLVTELLDSFEDAKRRYFLGDFRPQAVDGGRFSEAVGRVVEWATTGTFTPLGASTFNMDAVIKAAEKVSAAVASDALRLHIPRTLKLIYDIRNRRNTAHLRDGIDPNTQDAALIIGNMNWVLAELVRSYHVVSSADAQALIDELVDRAVPMIQEFDGRPRILKDVPASDHVLVLLYWGGTKLSKSKLSSWVPQTMRTNLGRTLKALNSRHLVNFSNDFVEITYLGIRRVETEGLISPI